MIYVNGVRQKAMKSCGYCMLLTTVPFTLMEHPGGYHGCLVEVQSLCFILSDCMVNIMPLGRIFGVIT